MRYFVQMGGQNNALVKVNKKVDMNFVDLETTYSIHAKLPNTVKKVLNIIMYHTTDRILVQGMKKKDFIEKDLPKFKSAVLESLDYEEALRNLSVHTGGINREMIAEADEIVLQATVRSVLTDVLKEVADEEVELTDINSRPSPPRKRKSEGTSSRVASKPAKKSSPQKKTTTKKTDVDNNATAY